MHSGAVVSAADSGPRTPTTMRTDGATAVRRLVTFSLGSDPESAVVRDWLEASADQDNESRRIRHALATAIQLLPHLERIETHLAVLARIEAHLTDTPHRTAADRSPPAVASTGDDALTQAEADALAALLDID